MNKFKELIGLEMTVCELSQELLKLGCEDICDFGNWESLLDDGNVVVAIDETGDEQIQIYFNVVSLNKDDESEIEACIEITAIDEF